METRGAGWRGGDLVLAQGCGPARPQGGVKDTAGATGWDGVAHSGAGEKIGLLQGLVGGTGGVLATRAGELPLGWHLHRLFSLAAAREQAKEEYKATAEQATSVRQQAVVCAGFSLTWEKQEPVMVRLSLII